MEEDKPILESIKFKFSQESNCVDGGEAEEISVRFESDIGIERTNGGFFVIETKQWAFETPGELTDLINRCVNLKIKNLK